MVRDACLLPALDHLKFLDESGVYLGMTRPTGRAAPGTRVVESTAESVRTYASVVATLSLDGVEAPWVFEGTMTAVVFRTYVAQVLVPTLQAGDLVILDNLPAHKDMEAHALIEACGARLLFLPPYSPDFNPIELCWATMKQALRAAKACTWETLIAALRNALLAIRPDQAEGWFAHCGYELA